MISNDNYDRFWTATVDDTPVTVYRANYTYKAIRLPAGNHIVEWRYNPWPVKVMWLWFYMTLIAFAIVWFLWNRRSPLRGITYGEVLPEAPHHGLSVRNCTAEVASARRPWLKKALTWQSLLSCYVIAAC
jgi:hypothetical protein